MTVTINALPVPTEEIIRSCVQEFDQTQAVVEAAISRLIASFPRNTSQKEVLLKVVVINNLSGTAIIDTSTVADHIVKQAIDGLLEAGDPNAVDLIAKVRLGNKVRNNHSFASKFCSWHNRQEYPIYDRFVDELLWAYRKQDGFSSFPRQDLCD